MKESRRVEAFKAIDEILRDGWVTPVMLPSVLRRLQFADGQLAGRAGKLGMADIRALGLHSKQKVPIDDAARRALEMLRNRFDDNVPKTAYISDDDPVLVFTDVF
eukprot:s3258_g11.t1